MLKLNSCLFVIGYNDIVNDPNSIIIETTSRSKNWSQGLSPFYLEGGHLYDNYYAKNVENAWQYSKVYKHHLDNDGNIKPEYFDWAQYGFEKKSADRYPMGKGAKPEFAYWNGERLSYIEARKKIYLPIYTRALLKSDALSKLVEVCKEAIKNNQDVYLLDYDGYNHLKEGKTFEQIVNDPSKSLGHAFCIWYVLKKKYNLF